jgi:hypothetical protein
MGFSISTRVRLVFMAALKLKAAPLHISADQKRSQEDTPPSTNLQKKKQQQQKHDKGKARAVVQEIEGGHAGPSREEEPSTSGGKIDEELWPWLSMNDASPSRQSPVFTKDGRCVLSRVPHTQVS